MNGIAEVALGELAIHSKGVGYARAGALEAERFTRPDNVTKDLGESTFYLTTPHIHNQPGYYFAYFMAALNRDALAYSLSQANGTLFSPNTARDLIDKIMIGNVCPMTERIGKVTGKTDLVQNSIDSYETRYKELS